MIEITASEPRRHIQIRIGDLLIGRVTRIEGINAYEIAVYDPVEDCYDCKGKLSEPTWEPYASFAEAVRDLFEHCGYGGLVIDKTLPGVDLMQKVQL